MAAKKGSNAESVDQLIAEISKIGGGAALRSALREMLGRSEYKSGAARVLRDFQRFLQTLARSGFKFSETFGGELRFAQHDFPEHIVALAPQRNGSVGWSHFSPWGTTNGTGLRSLKKLLAERYGRGIAYRGRRRIILAGPSSVE